MFIMARIQLCTRVIHGHCFGFDFALVLGYSCSASHPTVLAKHNAGLSRKAEASATSLHLIKDMAESSLYQGHGNLEHNTSEAHSYLFPHALLAPRSAVRLDADDLDSKSHSRRMRPEPVP